MNAFEEQRYLNKQVWITYVLFAQMFVWITFPQRIYYLHIQILNQSKCRILFPFDWITYDLNSSWNKTFSCKLLSSCILIYHKSDYVIPMQNISFENENLFGLALTSYVIKVFSGCRVSRKVFEKICVFLPHKSPCITQKNQIYLFWQYKIRVMFLIWQIKTFLNYIAQSGRYMKIFYNF